MSDKEQKTKTIHEAVSEVRTAIKAAADKLQAAKLNQAEKRTIIHRVATDYQLSQRLICQVMDVPFDQPIYIPTNRLIMAAWEGQAIANRRKEVSACL